MFLSQLHILVFGSTLLVYNTPRIVKNVNRKLHEPRQYKNWYEFLFILGFVMVIGGLYNLPAKLQAWCVVLGIFAFAYFLPVLPFKNKKRIRDFGWLKIAVLSAVWTTATAILPILYWQKNITSYPFEILLRLVFIFSLCVLFDIRDIQKDLENNIYTLPNKVGLQNSYRLIHFTLLLFVMLSIVQYLRYEGLGRLAGALFTAIITGLVANYLRKKPSDRAYAALADGVMLVYAVAVML